MNTSFFQRVYGNNTLGDYLYALAILLAGVIVLSCINVILTRVTLWREKRLKKSVENGNSTRFQKRVRQFSNWSGIQFISVTKIRPSTLLQFLKKIVCPFLFLGVLTAALRSLEFSGELSTTVNKGFL